MTPPRWVFFDCMETLIQMDIDSMDIYADWAFEGAHDLRLWDRDSFRSAWRRQRERVVGVEPLREGTVRGRISAMLEEADRGSGTDRRAAVERIHHSFWRRYEEASFVLPEVPAALAELRTSRRALRLGVASNFMVPGGIERLLDLHGLAEHFDTVIVSCDVGWRKPSGRMYDAIVAAAACEAESIVFVGDNPSADLHGPREAGMRAILYDRRERHPGLEPRVRSLAEVLEMI